MLLVARGTGSLAQPHYAVSSASSACLISAFGAFRFKTIKSPPAASGRPDRAFIRADAVASSLRICEPAPVAAAGGRRHPCEERNIVKEVTRFGARRGHRGKQWCLHRGLSADGYHHPASILVEPGEAGAGPRSCRARSRGGGVPVRGLRPAHPPMTVREFRTS